MDSMPQLQPSLLQLPDACLLAVLQCCADDLRSMFCAARAHSRLHQAAVLAASSIRAVVHGGNILSEQQQQADRVLLYLCKHGQHVDNIRVSATVHWMNYQNAASLRELPQCLCRLKHLEARSLCLQLQPVNGYRGVLHAGMPLQQLHLDQCELLDGEEGLAAALLLLPRLQHLSVTNCTHMGDWDLAVSSETVHSLQQLTHLELVYFAPCAQHSRGPWQLTGLLDLRLMANSACTIDSSTLSGSQQLTRLQVRDLGRSVMEPAVLAGKTLLQHLRVTCDIAGRSAGVTELLSHLQHLQQLTHIYIQNSLVATAPAAAYSALTASSKLQHLVVLDSTLPAGVWEHVFPAGRRLPHLQELDVSYGFTPEGFATAPDVSRLVSCCPGLQSLHMLRLHYSAELLAPLTGLSSLRELFLYPADGSSEGLEVVCQLTGLRRLYLRDISLGTKSKGLLLQLTHLRHLTLLIFNGRVDSWRRSMECKMQAPDDEPVWRQVLRWHVKHGDPDMAQQAVAAWAESDGA